VYVKLNEKRYIHIIDKEKKRIWLITETSHNDTISCDINSNLYYYIVNIDKCTKHARYGDKHRTGRIAEICIAKTRSDRTYYRVWNNTASNNVARSDGEYQKRVGRQETRSYTRVHNYCFKKITLECYIDEHDCWHVSKIYLLMLYIIYIYKYIYIMQWS
jgi:hypothetical protein